MTKGSIPGTDGKQLLLHFLPGRTKEKLNYFNSQDIEM